MKTNFFSIHQSLNAKCFDFHGWQMPLYYQGVVAEHLAVRKAAGLFDLSHMGRISISGNEAQNFLNQLATNDISMMENGSTLYTILANHEGKCIEDLIVFKISSHDFFVVTNAANRQKVLSHLKKQSQEFNVFIEDHFKDSIIALQGPLAKALMAQVFPLALELPPKHFLRIENGFISKTGYTGEEGFELFGSFQTLFLFWQKWIGASAIPCGLGARDTLRLEKGYALYGNELNEEILASETIAKWTIKWQKPAFIGKEALNAAKNIRHAYGITLSEGIARKNYPIYKENEQIGYVTSGNYSPVLKKSIALILVDCLLAKNDQIFVAMQGKKVSATLSAIPFI